MSRDLPNNDDEPLEQEIHIQFEPYEERLAELGVSLDEFEESLARAIDEHVEAAEDADEDEDVPALEDMPVHIANRTFRVSELADVSITSEDEDDEEDDWDEEDEFDDEWDDEGE